MQNTPDTTPVAVAQSSFPVPFTLEQLREDILNLYLLQLRVLCLFVDGKKLSELVGGLDMRELYDGYIQARTFGLTYEAIQDSDFAKAMEQQYSFAFLGIDNNLCEPFFPDGVHTWVAAIMHDLKSSATVDEWEQYGAEFDVSRCLHTCELANARDILEGGEGFYTFIGAWGDDKNKEQIEDALTIHQMALLSGMKEMSIRTEISRPSANKLTSTKEDRRTLVKIQDAKSWLIAKGRYLPVSVSDKRGESLNLEKTSFRRISDFAYAVSHRVLFLDESRAEAKTIEKLMELKMEDVHFKHRNDLLNAELMAKAATILDLPATFFVLRAKEAVLLQDLEEVSSELAAATKQDKS